MPGPTVALCACPNGCIVLTFGYVTVHLPRPTFLAFARRVVAIAGAIEQAPLPASEH